jgi:DNA-binding MarR family transcriptional regulator
VKIIVLTDEGRKLGQEIDAVLSVPPQAFKNLSQAELRQLRELLDKVLAATPDAGDLAATKVTAGAAS